MREPAPTTLVGADGKPPAALPPSSAPPPLTPRLPPRIVIWLLRAWWGLAAFVGAAILGDLLLLPLAITPNHWRLGVQSQFAALLTLGQAYPLTTLGIAVVVIALTVAGYIANRRERAAEEQARTARLAGALAGAVVGAESPRFDRLDSGQERLGEGQDRIAGAQAVNIALSAATLVAVNALARRASQMAPSGMTHRVFLSSTSLDLATYRIAAREALARINQFAVEMSQFGAGGADATTVSLAEVETAEYVVVIVGWRYGFIPQGETRSVTQLEYEAAMARGAPIYIYLTNPSTASDTGPDALFPAEVRDPEHAVQLGAFRALLSDSNRHTFEYFTTPDDLALKVATALARRLLLAAATQPVILARPDETGRVVALADRPLPGVLIGRDKELPDLIRRLINGEDVGVFALEGMGGVGKTALASAAVERLADDEASFPGGVIWLACAGLVDDAGLLTLLTQVARLIGRSDLAQLADPAQLRQSLSAALRRRPRTLLALDNIEKDFDAEAALRTLAAPGHVTVLLTAREQVAPQLVAAIPLAPLPTPDATQLFIQRLRQDTGKTRPTPEDVSEIPALVEAVGGLPLAVELLAADAGRQGTELAALRTELAAEGINAVAFRADPQRTLSRTFDRSWVTLPERQRRLFAGLGLLAEVGFPRAAAQALALAAATALPTSAASAEHESEAVEDTSPAPDPAGDVAALVRATLVEPLEGERLRLHPLLRAYAREQFMRLGPTIGDLLGEAVMAFWLEYARAHPSKNGNDPAAMDAQEAEAPGLIEALAWAYEHARWRALLDLVYALLWTWSVRGRRVEHRRFLRWAIEAALALEDRADLERMTHALALLDAQAGDPQRARAGYTEALALARELGDKSAIRRELHELAVLDAQAGEPQRARAGFTEALALARELGDKSAIQAELHGLAVRDANEDKPQQARAGFTEALVLARELGDKSAIQAELHGLAVLDARASEPQRARAGYLEALALARELGDKSAIQAELHGLAALDGDEGEPQRARAGYLEALALARELGDIAGQSSELQALGALDLRQGQVDIARTELVESLRLARQVEQPALIAEAAVWLAELERKQGHREAARAGFREALAIDERLGNRKAEITRRLLGELGDEP